MTESVFEVQANKVLKKPLPNSKGRQVTSGAQPGRSALRTWTLPISSTFWPVPTRTPLLPYGHLLNIQAELNEHAVVLASQSGVPSDPDGDPES